MLHVLTKEYREFLNLLEKNISKILKLRFFANKSKSYYGYYYFKNNFKLKMILITKYYPMYYFQCSLFCCVPDYTRILFKLI